MNKVIECIAKKKSINANNDINSNLMFDLINRVTGKKAYAEKFVFKNLPYAAEGKDRYIMYDKDGKIVVEATNGVTAACAFNLYLREYCNSYYGPLTKSLKLPEAPPDLGKTIENSSVFLFRYFMNYCTFGFTYMYADWNDYEKLTDWMLLSGVNLFLNIVGHEIVWRDLLKVMGYSKEEVNDFICGPGFAPWQWMGNVTHYGGILPEWWYDRQKDLSNKINDKMRAFGSEPMLPGYFGMVPCDFKEKNPLSNPIDQGLFWFSYKRPSILRHDDVMFKNVADAFYYTTKQHFGEAYYFSGDPFHEGGITDGIDLGEYAKAMIDEMKKYNHNSIWFLQGWCNNPKVDMLNAIDKRDVAVVDLVSDTTYKRSNFYGGYPFIYSSVSNYGGKRLMNGNVAGIMTEPFDAVKRDDILCIGIGMNMEAVEDNEILFEGLSYLAIREQEPDIMTFLNEFTTARYGKYYANIAKAWKLISDKVLTLAGGECFGGRESGLCTAPSLSVDRVSYSSTAVELLYDNKHLVVALKMMLESYDELKNNECYIFDITDIARQINANHSWELLDKFRAAFKNHDYEEFDKNSKEFLKLYDIQEGIMSKLSRTNFAAYVKRAADMGRTETEKNMFVFNALKLIFNWQKTSHPVTDLDYGHREWKGLLVPYYKKRWEIYIEMMRCYFDVPCDLPTVAWQEYAETFIFEQMINKTEKQSCCEFDYDKYMKSFLD